MPFDNEFFQEASLFAVREKNASRNHLTAQQRAWIHRLLYLTDGSIGDTVLLSGVAQSSVSRENSKLVAAGVYAKKMPPQGKAKPLSRRKDRQQREDALCKAIQRDKSADVYAMVAQEGLGPEYARMLGELQKERPNFAEAARVSGFGERKINDWRQRLGIPSPAERRAIIIYELCQDKPDLNVIAEKAGVHPQTVSEVVALTGTQKRYNPTPSEDKIRQAIAEHPDFSNPEIAKYLGPGFRHSYVWTIRKKINEQANSLLADRTREQLFLDTAVEIARRHLATEKYAKREQIRRRARRRGWMPAFAYQTPWPTSPENVRGHAIPKYRFLDVVLTSYLRGAGIKNPGHLISLAGNGFVQLQIPKPIFQALHYALAACNVSFDRLRIQNGFHQSWLPSPPQMITTARHVLGLKS